jgi:hypothetical protein
MVKIFIVMLVSILYREFFFCRLINFKLIKLSFDNSYSTYTHIYQLAQEIKKGVESVSPSIQVELYQVPETLSQEILDKMHAPPKPDIPIITSRNIIQIGLNVLGFRNKITYL